MKIQLQDILDSAQNAAFCQLSTKPNTINNYSSGLQENIKKVGLGAVVAASLFLANMGNAQANTNDALKVAAGISAIVGVVNHNNYALQLPGACDVRGVSGWKIGGATFTGSAIMSAFGGGNGQKLLMALGGYLGAKGALNYEEYRITQEMHQCAAVLDAMGANQRALAMQQKLIPQHLTTASDPRAIVFYSFPNQQGQQTFVSWETSPAVKSMSDLNSKGKDINKSAEAFKKFDQALDDLKFNYNSFEKISYQTLSVIDNQNQIDDFVRKNKVSDADAERLTQASNNNYKAIKEAAQFFQQQYQNYIQSRANFVAVADSAVMNGYSLKEHNQSLKLLQIPKVATLTCQCDLKESFAQIEPSKVVKIK